MKLIAEHPTNIGTFFVMQSTDGRYHPVFNDEDLGGYSQAWQAAEDLALNATYSVLHPRTRALVDTSKLGIPEDIREWGE